MYKFWQKHILESGNPKIIGQKYNEGFVLTRIPKEMHQVRSLRVNLANFELSSENRRILRKGENFILRVEDLPMPQDKYDWHIAATGMEFYKNRFGEKIFSANKIKELITDGDKSNFNKLAIISYAKTSQDIGWCVCYMGEKVIHYAYPFYDLQYFPDNLGIIMLTKTVAWAKEQGTKYFYLGSIWDKKSRYKLQFSPQEFFDGESWRSTTTELFA